MMHPAGSMKRLFAIMMFVNTSPAILPPGHRSYDASNAICVPSR